MATTYIVLKHGGEAGGSWKALPTGVPASSADEAIRKTADSDKQGGTFVAIPARSWKPRSVRVVQTTRLKLDDVVEKAMSREEPEA
jgi:hypothetical protein